MLEENTLVLKVIGSWLKKDEGCIRIPRGELDFSSGICTYAGAVRIADRLQGH